MMDTCEVEFSDAAERQMRRVGSRDPDRYPVIQSVVDQVEEQGWVLSTKSKLIRVLDQAEQIGEMRDVGRGGYRLFFFWHIEGSGRRRLIVTAVEKKSGLLGRARVRGFIRSAAKRRKEFLETRKDNG
jgi:hypothetical protein